MRDSQPIVREASDAPIVWMSGVNWDDLPGTDKPMALALSGVLPEVGLTLHVSAGGQAGRHRPGQAPPVGKRLLRLSTGIARLLPFAESSGDGGHPTLDSGSRHVPIFDVSIVVANPISRFPRGLPGTRPLDVTDDWLAGASLMGFSEATVRAG